MTAEKKRILVLVETSRAAGRGIIEGISRYVIEHQDWLLHLSERHIFDSPDWLDSWRGDGIIGRSADVRIHLALKHKRIPYVELHGDNNRFPLEVGVDESLIAKLAAEHLWLQGYRNFAFFALGNAWWIERRRLEFSGAISEYKAPCESYRSREVAEVYPSRIADDPIMRKVVRWVRGLPKPVGIWSATDLNAFYILEACLLAEIPVPGEVAVLGTDNDMLLCKALVPQLSSVDINAREIGYQAAILLAKKMAGEAFGTPVVTKPSHVEVRQSTETAAIQDHVLARAVEYIREHSNSTDLSVRNVARRVGLSVRTLQLKFKTGLASTPEQEIRKARLEHACRLLGDSDTKISAIPLLIGFTSASYFYRLFRNVYGVTPQDFRNRCRVFQKKMRNKVLFCAIGD